MTNQEKFNEAWRISRIAHKSYGFYGSVRQYFSESLRLVNELGKVTCLTLKQQLIIKNCLSAGARILNWSYEYVSNTETKVFAETIRNNKAIERVFIFNHNNTFLTKIN